jgi:hypothetical protein
VVTLVHHQSPRDVHFFLDFIFQSLNTSFSCNKTLVARFFHENGRENRTNGNQEKGKEEKEALRTEYEVE